MTSNLWSLQEDDNLCIRAAAQPSELSAGQTHLKNWGRCYFCVASPFFSNNSPFMSVNWAGRLQEFGEKNVEYSCPIQDLICSRVLGLLCQIFHFMTYQMFLVVNRSKLHGSLGVFSYEALLLCLIQYAVLFCLVERYKAFPEKYVFCLGAYASWESVFSTDKMQASDLSSDNKPDGHSPL